jgi:hypothetical protein
MDVQLYSIAEALAREPEPNRDAWGLDTTEALRADIAQLTEALRALTRAAEPPVQRRTATAAPPQTRRPPPRSLGE